MAYSHMTHEELRAMLEDLAGRIERGGDLQSATIRWMTDDGQEREHTFALETAEARLDALLAIRTMLGQVH